MTKIVSVVGREILDSRGNPTVEAEVGLDGGAVGVAAVPSGASTGEKEAVELRDGDKQRYGGKGVTKAAGHIGKELAAAVMGLDATNQRAIDQAMIDADGTPNKGKLGANAILAVSMAAARAAASAHSLPLYRYLGGANACTLPVPCMNVLNGGKHADNTVDFQEFMIAPHHAPSFAEAIRMGMETFHALKQVLNGKGYSTAVGDEGGFAPDLKSNDEAVELILEAITKAGYKPSADISICLDPAASEMWDDGKYVLFKSTKKAITSDELIKIWESWAKQYPIVLLEDGMGENDWDGWRNLTVALGVKDRTGGRRCLLHESADPAAGNRQRNRQCGPHQVESDRHGDGNAGHHGTGGAQWLPLLRLPPIGGNRGHLHCGSDGGDRRRPHQDRFGLPQRAGSEIQPVPPD